MDILSKMKLVGSKAKTLLTFGLCKVQVDLLHGRLNVKWGDLLSNNQ